MAELNIEFKLARRYTMENVPDALAYLLIEAVPNISQGVRSLPLNISLIIDVSGSMKGQKIKCAIEAAKLVVTSLSEDDCVSIVTFSDEAEAIVPNTNGFEKAAIFSALEKIRTLSGTRMQYGMELGIREMRKAGFSNKANRMIILTDGETEGEGWCRTIAIQEKDNNVVISTLGIGEKYNEYLLDDISSATLGSFFHLRTPEQISDIFQSEMNDASSAALSNVTLSLNLLNNVTLESIDRIFPSSVKLQPRKDDEGNALTVDIGNLKKGEPAIFGAKLKLPARAAGQITIAQAAVTYSVPSLQIKDKVENKDIIVEYTNSVEQCGGVDSEVIGYFNQLNAQSLVEQAVTEARSGNTAAAASALTQAHAITERLGNRSLSETIKQTIDELEQKGMLSADGVKIIKAGSRQTVRLDETQMK
ncbi:MAG: VWA domain-containing protein [Dehalococcoidia bacterium]|nr:VWA domain-containing protein [Dehalococcoidia bacterium]